MELLLIRDLATDEETTGKLYVDGKFFGYTLEDTIRVRKEYGDTCIPFRRDYRVRTTYSPTFKRNLPLVWTNDKDLTVSNRDGDTWAGIRFHGGNHHKHTLGCVLIAKNRISTPQKMVYNGVSYTFANTIQGSLIDPLIDLIGVKTARLSIVYDPNFTDKRSVKYPVYKMDGVYKDTDLCAIQNALNLAGNEVLFPVFDAVFKEAVIKFQKSKGLSADGVIGKDTLKALKLIWNGYELEQAFDWVNNKTITP